MQLHIVLFFLITQALFLMPLSLSCQTHSHTHSDKELCCPEHPALSDPDKIYRCGSTLYRDMEEKRNPELLLQRQLLEEQSRQWIKNNTIRLKQSHDVIVIPVVVHVVYNVERPEQNISYAQIVSQIDALNRDFRRKNADTINTPAIFKPLGTDARIEFQLAQRTPQGLHTTGVTRTPTRVEEFSIQTDNVKSDNTGGKTIWNRDKYLNFWVCNLEQGYLGYAQYPGGSADSDGIVVSYLNFGTEGTVRFPFNQGRTVTHEVGHWLNLVHTWGDEDNCEATDYVNDTPNQELAYYHCPVFPQISCDSEDMFMNYMDYTDDRCMNIFTQGQVNRMHSTLNGFRASIKNSDALREASVADFICDTLNLETLTGELVLYTASEGGYATGNNSYKDKAKAQFFENQDDFAFVLGAGMQFGAVNDNGGIATAALWSTGISGAPAGSPRAQAHLPLSVINQHVADQQISWMAFEPPINITGPFFLGVILPQLAGDTLALLASEQTSVVNAWEQWENNSWINFKDAWEGTLDVNLAIAALVCKVRPPDDPNAGPKLTINPNPLRGNRLNLSFENIEPGEQAKILITDVTGRIVLREDIPYLGSQHTIHINSLQSQGLFIIRVQGKNLKLSQKFILLNNLESQ